MTGSEHYREGERLLASAIATYEDDSYEAGPRQEYATDAAWDKALEISREMHEQNTRTAALLTAMAQAHFTAAQAAAIALGMPAGHDKNWTAMPAADARAWYLAAGEPQEGNQ